MCRFPTTRSQGKLGSVSGAVPSPRAGVARPRSRQHDGGSERMARSVAARTSVQGWAATTRLTPQLRPPLLLHLLGGFVLGLCKRLELVGHARVGLYQRIAVLVEVELLDESAARLPVGVRYLPVLFGFRPGCLGFPPVVRRELLVLGRRLGR